MRLDAYLAQYFPEHSRAQWQKYIKQGFAKVNGKVEKSAKTMLGEDDYVTTELPETPSFNDETLPIIYEDDDVIVINKPADILTHAKGEALDEFTVAEFMRRRTTANASTNRPGIVHRLDRATSGVMICAKNSEALKFLQKQFSTRKTKKLYIAAVEGSPKQAEAAIDMPIERNPKAPATFRVSANGKRALTKYKVLKEGKHFSLLELKPETGRTHQLRVHLAKIGNPIAGDPLYGSGKHGDRLFLHAQSLEITLPNRERKTFTAEVPKNFEDKWKS